MSAERIDPNDARDSKAEAIDLEMVDDGTSRASSSAPSLGGVTMSPADFMNMGPGMLGKALRGVLLEKLKKWFVRNLVVLTILALLSMEYKWARWMLYVWAVLAGIQFLFLAIGWYFVNKQAAKFSNMMKGMMPGGEGQGRP